MVLVDEGVGIYVLTTATTTTTNNNNNTTTTTTTTTTNSIFHSISIFLCHIFTQKQSVYPFVADRSTNQPL